MKTVITRILTISGICLLMLSACKKDGVLTISNGGNPGTLTASTTTPVLTSARLTDTTKLIKFSFTNANYGFSAVVTNTLQMDKVSDNWANPTSVTFANNVLTQGYSTADFNSLLLKLGIAGGASAQVQARIMYTISSSVAPVYSNVVTLTATPFNLTSYLYVVGSYQGYNTTNADSLFSATSNGIYTGIINFATGNNAFLILPAKNYNTKYATTEAKGTTSTMVTLGGPNDLYAPATNGYYQITLNLNTNKISFLQVNAYSVIGSTTAGGNYTTDVDLKYINDGNGLWSGVFAFTAGAFKIRQNHDWTYSWGDISPADGKDATSNSGKDINVAVAGTYKVTFNIPVSTIGTVPSVTATYTSVKQ